MSDEVNRAELAHVIRQWISDGKVVGEDLTSIILINEGSTDPVDTIHARLIPGDPDGQATDDLIERIAVTLERDAGGFRGVSQQYFVERRVAGSHRSGGRLPISLSIDRSEKRGGRGIKGTVESAMEIALRAADKAAERGDDAMARALAKAERDVQAADKRVAEGLVREENMRNELMTLRSMVDKMLTDDDARRIAREEAADRGKMYRELFQDLKGGIPIILNRIFADGGALIPIGELAPEQKLMREFVHQMDQGMADSAMNMLLSINPRVALMFAELVQTVQGEDIRRAGIRDAAIAVQAKAKEAIAASGGTVPSPAPLNGHAPAKAIESSVEQRGAMVPR